MNYKLKSILFILLFVAVMVSIGLFANFDNGITGSATGGSIACYENSDCDDKIERTEDICRNPGTEFSLCVNKPK